MTTPIAIPKNKFNADSFASTPKQEIPAKVDKTYNPSLPNTEYGIQAT